MLPGQSQPESSGRPMNVSENNPPPFLPPPPFFPLNPLPGLTSLTPEFQLLSCGSPKNKLKITHPTDNAAIAEALMTAAPEVRENFCMCAAQQDGCCPRRDDCNNYTECSCSCSTTQHVTSVSIVVFTDSQTSTGTVTNLDYTFVTSVV